MKHYAVSSYVPGSKYHGYHWPEQGPVDRATVVDGMPDLTYFTVLALPCKHPESLHWTPYARWAVIAIDEADYVETDGIVDFRHGEVVFTGDPRQACRFLRQQSLPSPSYVVDTRIVADWEEAIVGDNSLAVAGHEGRAIAGRRGLAWARDGEARVGDDGLAAVAASGDAHAGNHSLAFVHYEGTASAGDFGIAVTGEFSKAAAGRGGVAVSDTGGQSTVTDGRCALCNRGRATNTGAGCAIVTGGGDAASGAHGLAVVWADSGDREEPSTAIAGEGGLAIVDGGGHAKAGDRGIALASIDGAASAGLNGTIMIRWWDETSKAARVAVGYIDGVQLKPNVPYRLDEQAQFVEAEVHE